MCRSGYGASTASFFGSDVRPVLSRGPDNGVSLYEDEAMRTLVVLARLAAAIGLAAPAHADPSPDAGFLGALDTHDGGGGGYQIQFPLPTFG